MSKRKRHKDEQIHAILKEADAGVKPAELCRKYGMTQQTFYRWKSKYGGMELSDLKRLKQLEVENSELKKMVADQALDIRGLKAILGKKW